MQCCQEKHSTIQNRSQGYDMEVQYVLNQTFILVQLHSTQKLLGSTNRYMQAKRQKNAKDITLHGLNINIPILSN